MAGRAGDITETRPGASPSRNIKPKCNPCAFTCPCLPPPSCSSSPSLQVVAVSATSPRQALLFDVRTAARIAALDPPPLLTSPRGHPGLGAAAAAGLGAIGGRTPASLAGIGAGALGLGGEQQQQQQQQRPRSRGGAGSLAAAAACYSPSGQLLLWGNALYDLRAAAPVHQFDQFTDGGAGAFHPAGLEVKSVCVPEQRVRVAGGGA